MKLFELGVSLIKSLFQWKVENGKWKMIFIFPYNTCSTSQDKPSQLTLSKEGKSGLESDFQLTPPVEKGEGRVGAGLNKDNSDFTSKIFKTIFHFPLSIFNSLSICSGRNPNLQLAVDRDGEMGRIFFYLAC